MKRKLLVLASATLVSTSVLAQEPAVEAPQASQTPETAAEATAAPADTAAAQDTLRLTLAEAYQHALEHNRAMQKADLGVQKAERAKWQAISTLIPHADVQLGYNNFLGFEIGLMGMSIPMNPVGTLAGTVSEAIGGQMFVGIQLSKLALEMAQMSAESSEIDIKASAAGAYYMVLVAEESKKIMEQSTENLRSLSASTQSMVDVGMAEQTDADLISVQVTTMENSIRSAERNIELAYNSLRLVLGLEPGAAVRLSQTLDDLLRPEEVAAAATATFDLDANVNIRLLDKNIELARKQVAMQKWSCAPTLAVFFQYNERTYFGQDEGFNTQPKTLLGATLSVPLFAGGERHSKIKSAQLDVMDAELSKADAADGLRVQEQQLKFNLRSAMETYEVQKRNVELYQQIFAKTQEKYEAGTVSSMDLTNISTNLLQAQGTYVQALMELFTAQTNLQKLFNTL